MVRKILPLGTLALILAACGTVATPVAQHNVEETRIAQAATAAQETADAPTLPPPTETPIPPTATPVPPTATALPATDSPEPTDAPTEAAPADSGGESAAPAGNAAQGAEIFNTFFAEASFACSTCHLPNAEQQLIGPGLLNVSVRAATRVEGQSAEEYIRNSILHPGDYVVEGFPDMLMPRNYAEILSDEQLDNLVAYLFTLKG